MWSALLHWVSWSASVSQFQPTKVLQCQLVDQKSSFRFQDLIDSKLEKRRLCSNTVGQVETCWNFLVCLTLFSHVILCPCSQHLPTTSDWMFWGEEEFMVRQLERRWCCSLTICDPGSLNGENSRNWRNWDQGSWKFLRKSFEKLGYLSQKLIRTWVSAGSFSSRVQVMFHSETMASPVSTVAHWVPGFRHPRDRNMPQKEYFGAQPPIELPSSQLSAERVLVFLVFLNPISEMDNSSEMIMKSYGNDSNESLRVYEWPNIVT